MKNDDAVNSLRNINAVKSAAEVIRELLLEVKYDLIDLLCDGQYF